jgi:predicted nucleic acid-binding Zn ribbon protein
VKRRRARAPEAIGRLIPSLLRDLGMDETARVLRIAERWEEAVGPELARHCRPEALRGDVLEASVASSVWCQQLQLRAPEILAGLRRVLGDDAPSKLRLRVG